jgi:hypothetical protein
MDTWTAVTISLAFGLFVVFVVLPIIAAQLISLLDIGFRIDIHGSKLVWAALVLFLPILGTLLYWMIRPRDYEPLLESERPYFTLAYGTALATPAAAPRLAAVPAAPQAAAVQESEREMPRAA